MLHHLSECRVPTWVVPRPSTPLVTSRVCFTAYGCLPEDAHLTVSAPSLSPSNLQIAPPSLEFVTGTDDSEPVSIAQSRWTRFALSDGTAVRLVETL